MATTRGHIEGLHNKVHILWHIPNYFSNQKADSYYDSPDFHFLGSTWFIRIYPNGQRSKNSVEYVGLEVNQKINYEMHDVNFRVGIVYGKDQLLVEGEAYTSNGMHYTAWDRFADRKKLIINRSLIAPEGTLTIQLVGTPSTDRILHKGSQTKILDVLCNRPVPLKEGPPKNLKYMYRNAVEWERRRVKITVYKTAHRRDLKCFHMDTFYDVNICPGTNALTRDFQTLHISEEASDFTIRVKSRVFRAHRLILVARSTVFAAMFRCDMKEKITGSIDIEDCEPSAFEEFLTFMYTGRMDNLSSENVFDIFFLANKYDLSDLKQICIDFIEENLCLDMVCNVFCVADKFNLVDLKKSAEEFFRKNKNSVMLTENWFSFIRENPKLASEIILEAFS